MQAKAPQGYRIETATVLLWTLVCALTPVLMDVAVTAINKRILNTDPHASLIGAAAISAFVGLPILCAWAQWFALRRFAPSLALWAWAAASIVALLVLVFAPPLTQRPKIDFSLALAHWRHSDVASFDLVGAILMASARLLGTSLLLGLAISIAHVLALRSATKLPWRVLFAAAVAGGAAQVTMTYFPECMGIFRRDTLNGLSWSTRVSELTLTACAGAAYGLASSLAMRRMLAHKRLQSSDTAGLRSIGPAVSLAIICLPISIAVLDRDGGRAAGLSVLKFFSTAPPQDESNGEVVLQYSHRVEARIGKYPVVHFSPDSRYLILRDRERRALLVETASGRQLKQLGEALSLYERFDLAWAPDSGAVALRTQGSEDPVPGTRYRRNRIEIRTYAIPDGKPLAERVTGPDECYESHAARSLIYTSDGMHLWTLCDPKMLLTPESTMALKLDASSLETLRAKPYGAASIAGSVRTLGIGAGEILYLQRRVDGDEEELRLEHLNDDDTVRRIDPTVTMFSRGLLAQGDIVEDEKIISEYCGVPANSTADRKSLCRTLTFNALDGAVIGSKDHFDRRFEKYRDYLLDRRGLRIESHQQPGSKMTEILVIDDTNDAIRQRIKTREQRAVAFSPDGRWLVMHSPGMNALNIYRVTRRETRVHRADAASARRERTAALTSQIPHQLQRRRPYESRRCEIAIDVVPSGTTRLSVPHVPERLS